MSLPQSVSPEQALAGLEMFAQVTQSEFHPLWYAVRDVGFVTDSETVTTMTGHILAVRKARRHVIRDATAGMSITECVYSHSDDAGNDFGVVQANGELRACATCPFNRWGTAVDDSGNTKSRGKACREKRLILFLRDGDALPVVVAAPPSSIRAVGQFLSMMETRGKILPLVHVKLSIQKQSANGVQWGTLTIDPLREITPAEAAELWARLQGSVQRIKRWIEAKPYTVDRDDEAIEAETVGGSMETDPEMAAATAGTAADEEDRF